MVLRLDPNVPFEELRKHVEDKFTESADFFKDAKVTLAFEGRELTNEQEEEMLDIIDRSTKLRVMCIVSRDEISEKTKENKDSPEELNHVGQFFRGTLVRCIIVSGDNREKYYNEPGDMEASLIELGVPKSCKPGAHIIAKGNVVVLGRLKGTVYAGAGNCDTAFVAALSMEPEQIKIGKYKRKGRSKHGTASMRPKVAYVEEGMICFDTIS